MSWRRREAIQTWQFKGNEGIHTCRDHRSLWRGKIQLSSSELLFPWTSRMSWWSLQTTWVHFTTKDKLAGSPGGHRALPQCDPKNWRVWAASTHSGISSLRFEVIKQEVVSSCWRRPSPTDTAFWVILSVACRLKGVEEREKWLRAQSVWPDLCLTCARRHRLNVRAKLSLFSKNKI